MDINRTYKHYQQNIYYNFAMHIQIEMIIKVESRY